ncbi:helix-turn-helix domain-containing protein [Streptomyces cinerochromogenes]|uniref:helix-turn-helix domain-containing protein n=1 Tax=Streptomyces cinerochromogenes TaxID=66422 RepID=UPI0016711537|nr:AraC family transcriptional regulator [Streptomyces cinerochromogenes]
MTAKIRHDGSGDIPEVPFAAPAGTPAGVEVLSLADLRRRLPARSLALPQRPAFHHLLHVTAGTLRHKVDFTAHVLPPGSWMWVRPGQVQQWGDLTDVEGTLVLFEKDFLDSTTAATARLDDLHDPVLRTPAGDEARSLDLATAHLAHEFRALGQLPLTVHTATLRHLLAVLVLRLAQPDSSAGGTAPAPDETYARFRDAVERHFAHTRRVEDYARLLGYSPRTLSRATLAAAGVGAKEFIDRRVVLEAKRLLAHSDHTASRIADRLTFPSPTHFSKYFHHRTGQTPIAFRTAVRGRGGTAGPAR